MKKKKKIILAPQNTLEAFEQIFQSCRNSEISDEFLQESEVPLKFVCEKLGVTPVQAVLLSIILERGNVTSESMASHLEITNIKMYSLTSVISDLLAKKIISRSDDDSIFDVETKYRLSQMAKNAILKNEAFVPESLHCDNMEDFFSILDDLYCKRDNDVIYEDEHRREIDDLCQANQDLDFVKKFRKWSKELNESDQQLLLFFCMVFVKHGNRNVEPGNFSFIFSNRRDFRKVNSELKNHTSRLLKKGLVEVANETGVGFRNEYQLTSKAKKEFFPMLMTGSQGASSRLHSYRQIDSKELFYNDEERSQIDVLRNLLAVNHLRQVQARLSKSGMRTGVCCLLYGGPGTGKTATVLELARASKRDIFQVNLSELRSKWVGESEQLCQQLWDEYNACVENSKRAPILLLNECDGILTTRLSGATRSVDKMENTMANIFLENMEKQKGIVIATTNLAENLDPAFERRFIYKVCLGKPCLKARQSIWKAMLPELSENDTAVIAKEYEFSGGQIENIARKSMIDYVLNGQELTLSTVKDYCQQECLKKVGESKRIGFSK